MEGLLKATELNGDLVRLDSFQNDRWAVQVTANWNQKTYSVKETNLKTVPTISEIGNDPNTRLAMYEIVQYIGYVGIRDEEYIVHDYDMLFLGLADGLFTGYFSKGR